MNNKVDGQIMCTEVGQFDRVTTRIPLVLSFGVRAAAAAANVADLRRCKLHGWQEDTNLAGEPRRPVNVFIKIARLDKTAEKKC